MTTKHDAEKAIANMFLTRRQAAKNASLGAGRTFETHQSKRAERFEAARKAELARLARKAQAVKAAAESEPPVTPLVTNDEPAE